jgi:hypothetical protein
MMFKHRVVALPFRAFVCCAIFAVSSCAVDSEPDQAGADAGPEPSTTSSEGTDVRCTSMSFWTQGDRESPLMHPGGACIACHTERDEGPTFSIAGTLFPTAKEQDDCNGVDASYGATVVITDANGEESRLKVNGAGNFFIEQRSIATPYRAKVVYNGLEREMVAAQTVGDCNTCHTENGASGAPGRVYLP